MDPLGEPVAGQVNPLLNKLSTVKGVIESARAFRNQKSPKVSAGPATNDPLTPANLVLVKNGLTATDLAAFSVLTPSTNLVNPNTYPFPARRKPAVTAVAPTSESDPVVILVEPVKYNGIGRAVAAGVAVVSVQVTDTSHRFARPVAGDTSKLVSAETGPARLLIPPSSTGTETRYVLLGGCCGADSSGSGSGSGGTGVTSRGPGWTRGIGKGACLRVRVQSATGDCADAIDTDQEIYLYDVGDRVFRSIEKFDYVNGGSGIVEFWVQNGQPHLTIGGEELVWDAVGTSEGAQYIDFAGGGALCDPPEEEGGSGSGSGSGSAPATCDNIFIVRVECGACGVECGPHLWPRFLCVKITPGGAGVTGGCNCTDGTPKVVVAEYVPPEETGSSGVSWRFSAYWPAPPDELPEGQSPTQVVSGFLNLPCDPDEWAVLVGATHPADTIFHGMSFCPAACGGNWSIAYDPLFDNQNVLVADPDPLRVVSELYGGLFTVEATAYYPDTCGNDEDDGSGGSGSGGGDEDEPHTCNPVDGTCTPDPEGEYGSLAECEAGCVATGGIEIIELAEGNNLDGTGPDFTAEEEITVTVPDGSGGVLLVVDAAARARSGVTEITAISATFNGVPLNLDVLNGFEPAGPGSYWNPMHVTLSLEVTATTTGTLAVTYSTGSMVVNHIIEAMYLAQQVNGLADNAADQTTAATATGPTFTGAATGPTTAAPEYVHASMMLCQASGGSVSPNSWSGGWFGGQEAFSTAPFIRYLINGYKFSIASGETFTAQHAVNQTGTGGFGTVNTVTYK